MVTAFTVSKLFRENQRGGERLSPTQIRIEINKKAYEFT